MFLRGIRLTNVRQFEDDVFEFGPGFNLLVGENGAGKTTLLRAIVTVLGSPGSTTRRISLTDDDIRLRTSRCEIDAKLSNSTALEDLRFVFSKQWGERAQRRPRHNRPVVLVYGSNEATCSDFVSRPIRKYSQDGSLPNASDEAWLHDAAEKESTETPNGAAKRFGRSRSIRKFLIDILQAFSPKFKSFTWAFEPYRCSIRARDPDAKLPYDGFQWRMDLSRAIMRHLQERRSPFRSADRSLLVIDSRGYEIGSSKSAESLIPDFKRLLHATNRRNFPKSHLDDFEAVVHLTPRILIRGAHDFMLSQLSDGEKRLFSLFVDIARQLSIRDDNLAFRHIPAIVLIDEIDVHLHPKWQRRVVPALEDLFPSCQFIATTHSPFIVQGVTESKVQHLNRALLGEFTDRGIEEITAKVMGIEDHQVGPRYLEMLDAAKKYFKLVEKASIATTRKHRSIKELKDRLDGLAQRYARNPAYQAYLEIYGNLKLGENGGP